MAEKKVKNPCISRMKDDVAVRDLILKIINQL